MGLVGVELVKVNLDSRRDVHPATEGAGVWGAKHINVWRLFERGERCYTVWFADRGLS